MTPGGPDPGRDATTPRSRGLLTTLSIFIALLRQRFVEIEPLDRGFALGSRLFIAVLPLTLVAQPFILRDTSLGQLMTTAFDLEGPAREAAEVLFAPAPGLGAGVGLFAIIVLLYAVRGFARGMQRLYVDLWRVRLRTATAIASQVAWALWLAGYVVVDIALAGLRASGGPRPLLVFAASVGVYALMWAVTPTLLLARHVPLRRLVPTIVLTAVGVAIFEAASRLYFPAIATNNAERYGLIGFAFSLFSWLFINQTVVVLAALLGAVLDQVRHTDTVPP
jgi:membrane protein